MKLPKIAIILKGRPDKDNKKLLYIRYAINAKTSWLSLGISIKEEFWDTKRRQVKNKDVNAAKINQVINAAKFEADQIALDFITVNRARILEFPEFKKLFLKKDETYPENGVPVTRLISTLDDMLAEKVISLSSYKAYRSGVQSFLNFELVKFLHEINSGVVNTFKRQLTKNRNANIAGQYVRNLAAVFRHTVRRDDLQLPSPFTEKISIKRISNKKTLSQKEFNQLFESFQTASGRDQDILRRFFVLCKGLRYSDTVHLHKSDLKEFEQEGEKLKYFNRAAQKSGVAGMIVFYKEDHLLTFQEDGFLFYKTTVTNYNFQLRKISNQIIGRPITSHFGRHYAGDQAINSGFDIDDVKAILGISNEGTARIYAQRQNTKILTKLLMYEKDKKNRTDQ